MTSGALCGSRKGSGRGGRCQCRVRAPDCLAGALRSRSGPRLGVHSADINEFAVKATSEDRWNSAVVPWCVVPVRG